ncbi:hypothetical protein HHI36_007783 [Cryptolaemus montrouzieri]|uniref:Uncharacterized protein n=1 Tax=Cryptolaemus montrouzieri TaxID=559131 RepID=A0ABD2MQK3_9CUCU
MIDLRIAILKNLRYEKKQPSVEVKNEEGELSDKEEHINRMCREYFMELLGGEEGNTEGDKIGDIGDEDGQITSRDEVAEKQFTDEEIVEAIRKMIMELLMDVTKINTEMLKAMDNKGMELVRILFNKVWVEGRLPREGNWRKYNTPNTQERRKEGLQE